MWVTTYLNLPRVVAYCAPNAALLRWKTEDVYKEAENMKDSISHRHLAL